MSYNVIERKIILITRNIEIELPPSFNAFVGASLGDWVEGLGVVEEVGVVGIVELARIERVPDEDIGVEED
jgi:hypothetical protein